MNSKKAKEMRKKFRKYQRSVLVEMRDQPLKIRLHIAWMIIKGNKKGK